MMGRNGRKVIEDNIYSGIALASKTTHVNSRVNGVQRPIEGIDLMDVPQVECKMLYNDRKSSSCTLSMNSLLQSSDSQIDVIFCLTCGQSNDGSGHMR